MPIDSKLPLDVLLHVVEFIDHPNDLLALALVSRALHAAIVPRHVDYRRISCQMCSATERLWHHLLDAPIACSRIRYLSILSNDRIRLPRMCKMDPDFGAWWYFAKADSPATSPRAEHCTPATFIQALSRMINLKAFKFYTWDSTAKDIYAISNAIIEASCQLEELEIHFRVNEAIEQHFEEKGKERTVPLFLDHLPRLQKYVIYGCSSIPNSNVFLQMLSNAPNLTHIDVYFVSSPSLFLGNWPNLQHLTALFRPKYYQDPLPEDRHKSLLQSFFYRHSKLVTFSSNNILVPGWAHESDNFLPNLKSLRISIEPPQIPTMTFNLAARLTHLDISVSLHSYLQERKIVLPNLETCRYHNADPTALVQDLVDIIPNVKKLYMDFGYMQILPNVSNGFQCLASRGMTINEFETQTDFFACFKSLRVLLGPFDRVDVSADHSRSLFKLLYKLPSLSHIRTKARGDDSFEFLHLKRDRSAETMKCECVDSDAYLDECNFESWGGISLRR